MPGFLHFMRCVGWAVVKNAPRALASLVPFGEALFEIAKDVHEKYRQDCGDGDALKAELEELAQASAAEVQWAAEQVAAEAAPNQPEIRGPLTSVLSQMPTNIRQSLKRPADPSGKTIPAGLSLETPADLLPFLPAGPPRFKAGDRPLGKTVDWELVKLLGVGGFGEVWRARNPYVPHLEAALKFCLDPAAQQLLKYEAAVLARVMGQGKQPGIVELRHTYLSADPPCLEYEFIEGGDLASTVHAHQASTKGPLTPRQATKIVLALARAVGQVHKQSPPIVHRDLKPANVLVRQKGEKTEFLITDFGIGGVVASQSLEQTLQGTSTPMLTSLKGSHTPLYASPEQKKGAPPDPRDDVHALGVIWYQLLIGDFSAEAPAGGAWKKTLQQRGVADTLLDLLESCFDASAFRPPNAAVVAEQIQAILSPTPAVTNITVSSSRNPVVYGQAVTFMATVKAVPPTAGTPTGTVSLLDGTTHLGSAPLSGDTASITTSRLSAGSHDITVRYSGDAAFSASKSTSLPQTVTPAPLTVTATNARKVCGQANPDFVTTYSGFANGDSEAALTGSLSFTTPATAESPAGSYTVTPGGLTSVNYSITFVSGTLTVAPDVLEFEQDMKDALEEWRTKGNPRTYFERQGPTHIGGWQRAAQLGDATAQWLLARCLQEGTGVEKNPQAAVEWLRRAAESGLAVAQNDLGNCQYYGQGMVADFAEAFRLYARAAEQGFAEAMKNCGDCHYYGEGVEEDLTEAVRWYRKAAEQGHAAGQDALGMCYFNGHGVDQDYPQAINYYRKAAEQGLANAQANLGYCYDTGKGVKKDRVEAVKWYRKAAEQDSDWAQFNLGYCCEHGKGIEQDLAQAELWYRKAADQGFKMAKNALKRLLRTD